MSLNIQKASTNLLRYNQIVFNAMERDLCVEI